MKFHVVTGWISVLFLGPPLFAEPVRGRVETRGEVAVEHIRVVDVRSGREVLTDSRGRFALDCEAPCVLLVTHPRFAEEAVEPRPGITSRTAPSRAARRAPGPVS